MSSQIDELRRLCDSCSDDERMALFAYLRPRFHLHPLEVKLNTTAEVILEAIDRASDLSLRGVRGLIAEASFEMNVVKQLAGWTSVQIEGDAAYDFLLRDRRGEVTIQVKMQRLERKKPKLAKAVWRYPFGATYVVETQKTRGGTDLTSGAKTRPYRYGEFDILAVSMHPSTGDWSRFNYTVARWLIPREDDHSLLSVLQPVPGEPQGAWTSDLLTCVAWFRSAETRTIAPR